MDYRQHNANSISASDKHTSPSFRTTSFTFEAPSKLEIAPSPIDLPARPPPQTNGTLPADDKVHEIFGEIVIRHKGRDFVFHRVPKKTKIDATPADDTGLCTGA